MGTTHRELSRWQRAALPQPVRIRGFYGSAGPGEPGQGGWVGSGLCGEGGEPSGEAEWNPRSGCGVLCAGLAMRGCPRAPSPTQSCRRGLTALAPPCGGAQQTTTATVTVPVPQPQGWLFGGLQESLQVPHCLPGQAQPRAAPGCSRSFALSVKPPARLEPVCSAENGHSHCWAVLGPGLILEG